MRAHRRTGVVRPALRDRSDDQAVLGRRLLETAGATEAPLELKLLHVLQLLDKPLQEGVVGLMDDLEVELHVVLGEEVEAALPGGEGIVEPRGEETETGDRGPIGS